MRSCMCVFYAVLASRKLTDNILNRTMCLVEGSLNDRSPLTPDSDDPEGRLDQHSLTFPSLSSSEDYSHSKLYARSQPYANEIWQQWLSE